MRIYAPAAGISVRQQTIYLLRQKILSDIAYSPAKLFKSHYLLFVLVVVVVALALIVEVVLVFILEYVVVVVIVAPTKWSEDAGKTLNLLSVLLLLFLLLLLLRRSPPHRQLTRLPVSDLAANAGSKCRKLRPAGPKKPS